MGVSMTAGGFDLFVGKVLVGDGPNGDCWLWQGRTHCGYGYLSIRGRETLVHRLSYEHFVGPIPSGLEIDHLCRTTHCVNPEHLEVVTHAENIYRGESPYGKNARKTHCPHGHPYDEENTIWVQLSPASKRRRRHPHRVCRTCNRQWCSEGYQRRKARRAAA